MAEVETTKKQKLETQKVTLSQSYQAADKANTMLQFFDSLNVFEEPRKSCGTQIICTIGPACMEKDQIRKLIKCGMKIARLNMSHGTHEFHAEIIRRLREVFQEFYPRDFAIALDTKGPEIRTGMNRNNENIEIHTGSVVTLTTDEKYREQCTSERVFLDYKDLAKSCSVGQKILLADGSATLKVKCVNFNNEVECDVLCGASFGSRKNCCLPGVSVTLPAISEKDRSDLIFGVDQGLDMVFASFIRNAESVLEIREILHNHKDGRKILIVPKIENFEGVKNIDQIIKVSDGIMVARGDLGMDVPLPKVLAAQKLIATKCNLNNKPVICATQMMESMIQNRRPTRAEVSDIGNAVLDGVDCVMLSGETANGKYPDIAVKRMRKICREAERIVHYRLVYESIKNSKVDMTDTEGIAMAAASMSYKLSADAIIVFSTSGRTAQQISNFRPKCPVIVVSREKQVVRQLNLSRGLFSVHYEAPVDNEWELDIQKRLQFAIRQAKTLGIVKSNSRVVFVCGWISGIGHSNTVRIINVQSGDSFEGLNRASCGEEL